MTQDAWVLHSPLRGGWRGLEKCMRDPDTNSLLVFTTSRDAWDHLAKTGYGDYFTVAKIQLKVPDVAEPLGW